jgi:hypothetical protein
MSAAFQIGRADVRGKAVVAGEHDERAIRDARALERGEHAADDRVGLHDKIGAGVVESALAPPELVDVAGGGAGLALRALGEERPVAVAEVVGVDDDDVGPLGCGCRLEAGEGRPAAAIRPSTPRPSRITCSRSVSGSESLVSTMRSTTRSVSRCRPTSGTSGPRSRS